MSDALTAMKYYGKENAESRFSINEEELEILGKVLFADIYGYLISNSETPEGRLIDCIHTSVAMVEHIIRETTKEVMPDASLRYLSKYMRTDSQNLNDLVFRGENTTLADSVGYYHNVLQIPI